jgi:hypothetical protein
MQDLENLVDLEVQVVPLDLVQLEDRVVLFYLLDLLNLVDHLRLQILLNLVDLIHQSVLADPERPVDPERQQNLFYLNRLENLVVLETLERLENRYYLERQQDLVYLENLERLVFLLRPNYLKDPEHPVHLERLENLVFHFVNLVDPENLEILHFRIYPGIPVVPVVLIDLDFRNYLVILENLVHLDYL